MDEADITEQPEVEARIVHLDELEPQQVRVQRHPDGSERSVWDRWFVLRKDPPFVSLHTRWDPGVVMHRHGHKGHHVVYVLSGGMSCGDVWCGPGTHIEVPFGAAAGPYVAGPSGVELFEVTAGDGGSWEADRDGYARLLAEHGVSPLPNPPIALPDWMSDSRRDLTGLGASPDASRTHE
jgi:hypothetical protein